MIFISKIVTTAVIGLLVLIVHFSHCDSSSSCLTTLGPNSPNCTIVFYNEVQEMENVTCVEANTFVTPSQRVKPTNSSRRPMTMDSISLASRFSNEPVPLIAKISCKSSYSTDFEFKGVGALDFFRIWKVQVSPSHVWDSRPPDEEDSDETTTTAATTTSTTDNSTTALIYTLHAEILLTPEATGKYTIYSIANYSLSTSFFIFAQKSTKPYLIGATSTRSHKLKPIGSSGDSMLILPCVVSNYNVTVNLYMRRADDNKWLKMVDSSSTIYNRKSGFLLSRIYAYYKCTTGEENDSDFVVMDARDLYQEIDQHTTGSAIGTNLTLTIRNDTAICTSTKFHNNSNSSTSTVIKLTNIYSRNPTDSRLLIECLRKGNSYCGTHSYHQAKLADELEIDSNCTASTSCAQIQGIHQAGVLYCSQGAEDFTEQEYFTGLDSKIYTDWKSAPLHSLLIPKWDPNVTATELITGTLYGFYCKSVETLFLQDPFILSVKYKNGSLVQIAKIGWWRSRFQSFYLTTDMEEMICGDYLWETNELISSGVKLTIQEKQCGYEQFKCKNFQCIRDTWRCDGDIDCQDGSDEEDCSSHTCKAGHFQCSSGFCILEEKKCNNKWDCADRSDEEHATCWDIPCDAQEFKCDSGQCMPAHFLCDNDHDCIDGSDESLASCRKYQPQIVNSNGTKPTFIFQLNSMNELICEINLLPERLSPDVEWSFGGENITDRTRLWKDITGLKLSLRFRNVTKGDEGEYKCSARNSLGHAEYLVNVLVEIPDTNCTRTLDYHSCLLRKCYFNHEQNSCFTKVDFDKSTSTTTTTTTTTTSTTTTEPTTKTPTTSTSSTTTQIPNSNSDPQQLHIQQNYDDGADADSENHPHLIIGIIIIVLVLLISTILGALSTWKYFTGRNRSSAGSARMHEDEQIVLNNVVESGG